MFWRVQFERYNLGYTSALEGDKAEYRTPLVGDDGEFLTCPRALRYKLGLRVPSTGDQLVTDELVDFDCGTWNCPYCGPKKKRRLAAHFTSKFAALPHLKMLTLTVDPQMVPLDESRKHVLLAMKRLRNRLNMHMQRRGLGRFFYMFSLERTKRGYYHAHMLCSIPMSNDELRRHWFECKLGVYGYVDDLEEESDGVSWEPKKKGNAIRSRSTAKRVHYCLKYSMKEAAENHVPGRQYVYCSEGIGYFSEASKQERRDYVLLKTLGKTVTRDGFVGDENRNDFSGQVEQTASPNKDSHPDPELFYVPMTASYGRPKDPDAITDADLLAFNKRSDDGRRSSYVYKDRNAGTWHIVERVGERFTESPYHGSVPLVHRLNEPGPAGLECVAA